MVDKSNVEDRCNKCQDIQLKCHFCSIVSCNECSIAGDNYKYILTCNDCHILVCYGCSLRRSYSKKCYDCNDRYCIN